MSIQINGWFYLSQMQEPLFVFGAALAMLSGAAWLLFHSDDAEKASNPERVRQSRRVFGCGALAGCVIFIAAVFIPSRHTILYSATAQYGPEYVERLFDILEARP